MPPLDDYLRRVESSLRCPAERRPALIEELGAHLQDRVEALVAQGRTKPDAEREAMREMGPAWLLALRLSAANGWNVTAHVLREIWAALLSLLLLAAPVSLTAGIATLMVRSHPATAGTSIGVTPLWASYVVLAACAAVFAFALARVVEGWVWATVPCLGLGLVVARPTWALDHFTCAVFLIAAVTVMMSAVLAARPSGRPRQVWLAWAVIILGLVLYLWFEWSALTYGMAKLGFTGLFRAFQEWGNHYGDDAYTYTRQLVRTFAGLALPWVFWLAAWCLDRYAPKRRDVSAA